jgi:hypothetical protein
MNCEHMNQYPDKQRKTWVCKDCGKATVRFYNKQEREAIEQDERRFNRNIKRILSVEEAQQ